MSEPPESRCAAIFCSAAGVLLFAYTSLRAVRLSFTFDESLSYLTFVRGPWSALLDLRSPLAPNNHFLNTLLLRALVPLAGSSEWALRLPNLLAHLLFLTASWHLVRRLGSPWLAAAGFLVVNANPFVLDFFSLSRGYGLSLAGLEAALAAAVGALDREGPGAGRGELAALAFASLAVLANFPCVIFLACLAAGILWRRWRAGRSLLPAMALSLPAGAAAAMALWVFRGQHLLYFGGREGFWKDTVGSLLRVSFYGHLPSAAAVMALEVAIAVVVVACAAALLRRWRAGDPGALADFAPYLLLLGCAVLSVAAHALLGVRYLISRGALLYYPLFAHSLLGLLGSPGRIAVRRVSAFAAVAFAVLVGANFARAANLSYDLTWKNESQTREFFDDLEALHRAEPERSPSCLAVSWVMHYSALYYRETRHLDWIAEVRDIPPRTAPAPDCESYFYCGWNAAQVAQTGAKVVKEYPVNPNFHARRTPRPPTPSPAGEGVPSGALRAGGRG